MDRAPPPRRSRQAASQDRRRAPSSPASARPTSRRSCRHRATTRRRPERGSSRGRIAAAAVAKSDPDGYTLLLNTIATHGIGPHIYANLPYDPAKDFAPVILVAKLPLIMTVNADLPAQSVKDVIALAKARPGGLSFASAGNGGAPHLAASWSNPSPGPISFTWPTVA